MDKKVFSEQRISIYKCPVKPCTRAAIKANTTAFLKYRHDTWSSKHCSSTIENIGLKEGAVRGPFPLG